MDKRLLIFGLGYTGGAFCRRLRAQGWSIRVILREGGDRQAVQELGAGAMDVGAADEIRRSVREADALLVVAAPSQGICPGLRVLSPALSGRENHLQWIGYLSSTSVYGDQGGAWTYEDTPLRGASPEGKSRIQAERAWLELCQPLDLPLVMFRLAGIYGPGRSALDRIRQGTARRIEEPDHVLSRIHVEDLLALLEASLQRGERQSIYNVCDDEPASAVDVVTFAAGLLGTPPPPIETFESAAMSAAAARFFMESRRISNSLAKRTLDWRPGFPSYREGLAAILAGERQLSCGAGPTNVS